MKERIKLNEIKVKEEYLKRVPRMKPEDLKAFKESIELNGIQEPLVLNSDLVLLDGHSRYQEAKDQCIEYVPYRIKDFKDILLEKKYVAECNLARRHLNTYQKIELGDYLVDIEKELAKKRMSDGGKGIKVSSSDPTLQTGRITDIIAKRIGSSSATTMRGLYVKQHATPQQKESLLCGKTEINTIYKQLKKQEKTKQRKDELKKIKTNLPKSVTLFNNDFKKNNIAENSVSLIITDPDYTKYNSGIYEELAKHAMSVLKPGGSMLCYTGHYIIPEVLNAVKKTRMKFHWLIPVLHSGPSVIMYSKKIMVSYKPLLWFTKGNYNGEYVKDVIKSEFQGKELHEWAQSTVESDYYIKHITEPGDIVYDPFMGQGTFGVSAIKLDRKFIGSDIDKTHYETAKKILSVKVN